MDSLVADFGISKAINARLRDKALEKPILPRIIKTDRMKLGYYESSSPHIRPRVPVTERDMATEIKQNLSEADALAEANRCMSRDMCMDRETSWMYCTNNCFVKFPKGEHYKIKLELCNG